MEGNAPNLTKKIAVSVLGRSGCGKGTQAARIMARLGKRGGRHVETGKFLRAIADTKTPTAAVARKLLSEGKLFPAWLVAATWLKDLVLDGHIGEHLIFDGAPRKVWEAKLLDEVLVWHGRAPSVCIYLAIRPRVATERLLGRGRADDTKEAIRNRMRFFTADVLPVIRYYKREGRLIIVDGEKRPEEVWVGIDRALKRRFKWRWPHQS